MMKMMYCLLTCIISAVVSFTDNSEKEPWKSSETYSYIIEANNKIEDKWCIVYWDGKKWWDGW